MANLVAKRCTVLERAEDRELVWFLQWLSHQDGGLKRLAVELCARFPDRIATPAMQRMGAQAGQIYNAKQVKLVRAEIPNGERDFALKGEIELADLLSVPDEPADTWEDYTGTWQKDRKAERSRLEYAAAKHPASYAAADFSTRCLDGATQHLERQMGELCLDPAASLVDGSPWYFPTLVSTLRELLAGHVATRRAATKNTAIGKQVFEALDYALATGKMVLIDGRERRGKSHATKAWCEQHQGAVRYALLEATNDDFSFFRILAESIGVSCSLKSKAQELRERVAETLQKSKLMLVVDEAHYLWPQSHYRHTTPGRINWLMTALVNHGVPVALVTTPQFFRSQKEIEDRTHWTSGQFTGRIGHYAKLPENLSQDDLRLVARTMLPEGDSRSIESLADYAQGSKKYLSAVEDAASRARYLASKSGRSRVQFADVKQAILESVIPSDSALAAALAPVEKSSRRQSVKASAPPLQRRFTETETDIPATAGRREIQPGGERNRLADLEAVPG